MCGANFQTEVWEERQMQLVGVRSRKQRRCKVAREHSGALVASSRRGEKEQWGYILPKYSFIWKFLG